MKIDIRFIILYALSVFLFAIFGEYFFSVILVILTVIAIIASLEFIVMNKSIRTGKKESNKKVYVDDKIPYEVFVENRSILNFSDIDLLTYEKDTKFENRFALMRKDVKNLKFDTDTRVRGLFRPADVEINYSDFFKIFSMKRRERFNAIKVYPKIVDLIPSISQLIGDTNIKSIISNDSPVNSSDMRKYVAGDSIRKINWKVSARHGELFIRRDENYTKNDVVIILDMNEKLIQKDKTGLFENHLFSYALSLSSALLKSGREHIVILNLEKIEEYPIRNESDFDELLERIIIKKADEKSLLSDAKLMSILKEKLNSTLIFFTLVDDENLDAVMSIKDSEHEVIIFTSDDEIEKTKDMKLNITFKSVGGYLHEDQKY